MNCHDYVGNVVIFCCVQYGFELLDWLLFKVYIVNIVLCQIWNKESWIHAFPNSISATECNRRSIIWTLLAYSIFHVTNLYDTSGLILLLQCLTVLTQNVVTKQHFAIEKCKIVQKKTSCTISQSSIANFISMSSLSVNTDGDDIEMKWKNLNYPCDWTFLCC